MIIIYKASILCLLLNFSITPQSTAQNESLRFEHIGIEEGLSNENVTQILQDSKGYIWFGTFDGLNKYDGYSFTKYRLDPFDSNSISQNFIYTIWEDKYGVIWVSSFEVCANSTGPLKNSPVINHPRMLNSPILIFPLLTKTAME
jgi:ligand-binding sensor domain-containing protein